MEISQILIGAVALIAAAGATVAYFARSRGTETIRLLQANIEAYQDSEKLKDARITYLEGQLTIKEETIKRLLKK